MTIWRVKVEVSPRSGIADPAGATIERSLPALGFETVQNVRLGKLICLEIEAENREEVEKLVADMSERFLTNPVIEDSYVEIFES